MLPGSKDYFVVLVLLLRWPPLSCSKFHFGYTFGVFWGFQAFKYQIQTSKETNRNWRKSARIQLKHFCLLYHPETWQSILNLYKKSTVAKSLTGTRLVFFSFFLFFSFLFSDFLKVPKFVKMGRGNFSFFVCALSNSQLQC